MGVGKIETGCWGGVGVKVGKRVRVGGILADESLGIKPDVSEQPRLKKIKNALEYFQTRLSSKDCKVNSS